MSTKELEGCHYAQSTSTFALWPHSAEQLEDFDTHLNEQHPHIQFTREEETNNQISFLDVLVKKEDGTFRTMVYRKPTHTDMFTHFTSHHHPRVKSGTIGCLARRAEKVCDNTKKEKEMLHLHETFKRNGYPEQVISKNLKPNPRTQTTPEENAQNKKPPTLFLPYVQGLSEKTQTASRKIGERTIFKSHGTLRQLLTKVKIRTSELKKKEVVYRVPCQDCDGAYIGETGRSLQKRLTEHKYAVRTNDRKNGIAVHDQIGKLLK